MLSLKERGEDQVGLQTIVYLHLKDAKPIPLRIVQRVGLKPSAATDTTHLGLCCECHGIIKEMLFKCSQCEDYKLCSHCVTSGKHPQHNTIIRCFHTDNPNVFAFIQ